MNKLYRKIENVTHQLSHLLSHKRYSLNSYFRLNLLFNSIKNNLKSSTPSNFIFSTQCKHGAVNFRHFTQISRIYDRKSLIFAYFYPFFILAPDHHTTPGYKRLNKGWTVDRRTIYRSFNENTSFFLISVHFYSFFLISVHFHSFFLISVHFYFIFTVSVHLFICSPFLNRFFLHLVHLTWCNINFF